MAQEASGSAHRERVSPQLRRTRGKGTRPAMAALRGLVAVPVVLAMALGGLAVVASSPAGASSVHGAAWCFGYAGTTPTPVSGGPGCLQGFGGSSTGVAGAKAPDFGVGFTVTSALTGSGYFVIDGRSTAAGIQFPTARYDIDIATIRYTSTEGRTVRTRTAGCSSSGTSTVSDTGSYVRIPVPTPVTGYCTVPAHAIIEILLLTSVVNPPTAGQKRLQISTSRDTTPVTTNAVTLKATPSAPANLTATASSQHVALTWTSSTTTGGTAITGYNVYEGTSSGGESAKPVNATPLPKTATSYTLDTLANGTTYYFTVKAANGIGTSAASKEASATPATTPTPPTLTGAAGGNTHVALSWTPPATDGGSAITSYDVYVGTTPGVESTTPVNATPIPGTATGYTVTGLTNGTTYYFIVKASNDAGTSVASNELSGTPTTTKPGPPTGLAAARGDRQVTLTWTAPATDGGTSITTYQVFEGAKPGTEGTTPVATVPAATTSTTVGTLTNGTPYYFTVKAVNGLGTSTASKEASATPATVPGPPTGLAATPGNRSVALTWSAPATDGGTAITGYNVYEGTAPGTEGTTPVATVPASTTGYTVDTLTNGTTYYFTVKAVNGVGASTASTEASATPTGTAPTRPRDLKASSGTGTATLEWTAPSTTGGYPLTYDVYEGTSSGQESATPVNATPITGTTYTVTGLTNGTTYFFTVKAVNTAGTSGTSNEASATPAAAGTTAVSDVTVSPGSNSAGIRTTYTVTFTTGPSTTTLGYGDMISLTAPAGTTFSSSAGSYTVDGTTATSVATTDGTGSTSPNQVEITVPESFFSIHPGTSVLVTVGGVTNPDSGTYAFTVSTTVDSVPATSNSYTITSTSISVGCTIATLETAIASVATSGGTVGLAATCTYTVTTPWSPSRGLPHNLGQRHHSRQRGDAAGRRAGLRVLLHRSRRPTDHRRPHPGRRPCHIRIRWGRLQRRDAYPRGRQPGHRYRGLRRRCGLQRDLPVLENTDTVAHGALRDRQHILHRRVDRHRVLAVHKGWRHRER